MTLITSNIWEKKMRDERWFNLITLATIFVIALKFTFSKYKKPKNLPPSPPALPIIGHLHLLKPPLHITLHELSKKYGHVMFLRFGTRKVVIVSSPVAAEECFTKNDIIFANRPKLLAGEILHYNRTTLGFANYGDHWRSLRRLISLEMFSPNRLAMFSSIRQDEINFFLKQLYKNSSGKPMNVDLKSKFAELACNIMMGILAGKRYFGMDLVDEEAKQFRGILSEVVAFHENLNLGDFIPFFKLVDIQGSQKKMKRFMKKMDKFFQYLVEECRQIRTRSNLSLGGDSGSNEEGTLRNWIDGMLSRQEKEPESYPDSTVKGVILIMLMAGIQTTATTMEWAMTLLLNDPKSMKKALAEIDACVRQGRLLNEKDLPKLNYLHNIINETLRLYPPVPLNLAHESSEDSTISGFHVPQGTMLFFNLWTIQRDPELWEDSTLFIPERFEGGEGEGYKLIPFGAGRRACPGASFARRMVPLAIGTLIQSFEWERVGTEEIEMTIGLGLNVPKDKPLEALCTPRENMISILSQL